MLDFVECRYELDFRIADPQFVFKKIAQSIEADIGVFVDRCPKNRSWMAGVVGGIVGPSSKKTDPDRGAGNDASQELTNGDKRFLLFVKNHSTVSLNPFFKSMNSKPGTLFEKR